MDEFDLVKDLETYLVRAAWGEGFVSGEQVVLKGLTELLYYCVGPDLLIKGFHHILWSKLREVFDITKLAVQD